MAPQNPSSSILGTQEGSILRRLLCQYFSTTTVLQYAILDNDRNLQIGGDNLLSVLVYLNHLIFDTIRD